jgi:hypothetical protein
MKTVHVELKGTGEGLLMHSTKAMMDVQTATKKNQVHNKEDDAEISTYRNSKGELVIPSRCLKKTLLNGASWYKFKKLSAKQVIAGCTRIEPLDIVLLDDKDKAIKDYEIDQRTVVIQQSRIIRSRPLIRKWKARFDIIYNDEMIQDVDVIRKILEESGQRIGVLDNRPQCFGENGTFEVSKFLPQK